MCLFFFKQKTAYDMRISDWSSDVCSSDLSGSLAGEWERLEAACLLDRAAALQSASWGLFQIMGFNYSYAGFADVEAFAAAQHAGAEQQAGAFARFISRPPLPSALRRRSWQKEYRSGSGRERGCQDG